MWKSYRRQRSNLAAPHSPYSSKIVCAVPVDTCSHNLIAVLGLVSWQKWQDLFSVWRERTKMQSWGQKYTQSNKNDQLCRSNPDMASNNGILNPKPVYTYLLHFFFCFSKQENLSKLLKSLFEKAKHRNMRRIYGEPMSRAGNCGTSI